MTLFWMMHEQNQREVVTILVANEDNDPHYGGLLSCIYLYYWASRTRKMKHDSNAKANAVILGWSCMKRYFDI